LICVEPMTESVGEEQERIHGHSEGWSAVDSFGGTDLSVANTDELLLIAMIDLDVPSREIGSNGLLERQIRISTDEKSWLTIEQAPGLGETVTEWPDDDDSKRHVRSSLSPEIGADGFHFAVVETTGCEDFDGLPRNVRVNADLIGCRSAMAIESFPAACGLSFGGKPEFSILANATDQGSSRREILEHGLIHIATVNRDDERAGEMRLIHITTKVLDQLET